MNKRIRFGAAAIAVTMCVGCWSSGPFDYVPVSGKIVYDDGTPIPIGGMRLVFIAQDAPENEEFTPRPAQANVDADGEFECVTSYKYGDGLIPGRHKVVIHAEAMRDGRPIFPSECLSELTTPLVVDTADTPLDIRVRKP